MPVISACILARNEERRIEEALRSLQGWTDEILVIDNESEDGTVAVARRYTEHVLTAPRAANFDAARNLAVERASGDWIFYLDADERVPPALGAALRQLVRERGEEFEALLVPFKHYFCGKWIQHSGWSPGYTRPQLLKKGRFRYNERLHSGIEVDGRTLVFPADDPDLAIVHYSYDDLHHYLEKLNRYTDGEAENLLADGHSHCWQAMLAHFVVDWQLYYERGRGDLDGMHGFVLAFMSAFYRFASRAKLWDLRRQRGEGSGINTKTRRHEGDGEESRGETAEPVPADLREMLEFMARVVQEGPARWLDTSQKHVETFASSRLRVDPAVPAPLLWRGPVLDASGFAEEGRNFVLGLMEAGEAVAVAPEQWGGEIALPPGVGAALEERVVPGDAAAEVCVTHTLLPLMQPSPTARVNVARALFETDRLPEGAAERLNRMDRVWVASEFNRETFVRSGVDPDKIAVVPGAIDVAPFAAGRLEPWALPGEEAYRFLSVFDWSLHKGWDVLLEAFALEFGDSGNSPQRHGDTETQLGKSGSDRESVGLILKVWSSNGYSLEDIRGQADRFLWERIGRGLAEFPNIHFWQEMVPVAEMPRVYRAVEGFVLPTRGEGWCRPLMEAMAAGLPTIATAWSGLTAFHNARVGYPLKYRLMPVSAAGAREIPVYAGHCWAEPDVAELRRLMRELVEDPATAKSIGLAAQSTIGIQCSRAAVTAIVREELAVCRELAGRKFTTETQRHGEPVKAESVESQFESGSAGALATRAPLPRPFFLGESSLCLCVSVVNSPPASVDFRARLGRAVRVRWEGNQALLSSLALVNRQFCTGLLAAGDVELSWAEGFNPWRDLAPEADAALGALFARQEQPLSGPADVTVRHHFPPNWERPAEGKLIVVQPWEYGHLPRDWVEGARQADEVWVYSRFVRDVYARSGVPAEKVRVVPLGFDPALFQPAGPRYALPTRKSLRFLFVGGALDRKGADLLLEAYRRAFIAEDDVCLVVKDMGTRTFYQGQTFGEAFRQAQHDANAAELLYLDMDLADAQLAALYRACSCVVLPYRGEGFALSPLEGMACGLPAIVTAGGPTDDYLDDTMALRVPARRRDTGQRQVGPFECVGDPWQLEPDLEALVAAFRWVRDHPEETRRRGEAACTHAHGGWTWAHGIATARERMLELVAPDHGHPIIPARPWVGPDGIQHEYAQEGTRKTRREGFEDQEERTSAASPLAVPIDPSCPSRLRVKHADPEISLCMIARDEEARIGCCLESAAPFVDEMIVVDTGSTDRTREVAAGCGARVFDFPWVDCFATARNQSVEQARGTWIFWMDADDVLPAESGRMLRELVRRRPERDAAYQAHVRIPPGPGEFSETLVDHMKLFPNRPDLRFEHRIHEQILPALRRAGLEVLFSDLSVVHQNYDRSEAGQEKKRRRDFRLLELDLRDRPNHPFILFNLGMTHLYATKEYEVAAQYLRRSLDASDWRDSIVRKSYAMLTLCRTCRQEWEAAVAANEEGRAYYPEDAELLFQAGQIYQQVGRFDEARRALERLVEGREEAHYRSVDTGLRGHRGRHELALLFRRMGSGAHCAELLREIGAAVPEYVPARLDLVETLCMLGDRLEAQRLLAGIPDLPALREPLERLRGLLNGARGLRG